MKSATSLNGRLSDVPDPMWAPNSKSPLRSSSVPSVPWSASLSQRRDQASGLSFMAVRRKGAASA